MATLYVTEQGVQVHKIGQRLILKRGQDVLQDIPMIKVDRVVLMGKGVSITTPALRTLVRHKIDVVYTNQRGTDPMRVLGQAHQHSRLRYQQALAISQPEIALTIARAIVQGKINNQRVLVQRHAEGAGWAGRALQTMDDMMRRVASARSLDEVRGLEGMAAKEHYGLLRRLFRPPRDGDTWGFENRNYYPPLDPINALLSFGYTLLLHNLSAACQISGLDSDLGFFHAVDFGKPAMALDLEEEFRPIIVDSIVLTAVNRPLFGLGDFERGRPRGEGDEAVYPVLLREEARNRFIALYETRVNEGIYYPLTNETTPYKRVFELQAYQMARVILGEKDMYEPLMVK